MQGQAKEAYEYLNKRKGKTNIKDKEATVMQKRRVSYFNKISTKHEAYLTKDIDNKIINGNQQRKWLAC